MQESVLATHEADHRYVISGYIRDADGVPIKAADLFLEHKGGLKKEIKTDAGGYYEVLFHLHNNNLGDEIIIRFGETTKKHRVEFDPKDKFTSRGVTFDFGAPSKEGATVWIYLATGGLVVFGAILFFGSSRKKKKIEKKERSRKKGIKKKR